MLRKVVGTMLVFAVASVNAADQADASQASDSNAEVVAAQEQSQLANDLANYADTNEDALAMIVAASISKMTPGAQGVSGRSRGASDEKPTATATADRMLSRATELAGDRKDLLALIADVEEQQSRGITTCWAESNYGYWYWTGPSYSTARRLALNLCRSNSYGAYCWIDYCD